MKREREREREREANACDARGWFIAKGQDHQERYQEARDKVVKQTTPKTSFFVSHKPFCICSWNSEGCRALAHKAGNTEASKNTHFNMAYANEVKLFGKWSYEDVEVS